MPQLGVKFKMALLHLLKKKPPQVEATGAQGFRLTHTSLPLPVCVFRLQYKTQQNKKKQKEIHTK